MADPAISAGVVMYGGPEEAQRCLASLVRYSPPGTEVFLIDNASPDDALAELEALGIPEGVRVLPQAENRGFGAGHNTVLPLLHSRYHAVVNPDIELHSDALGAMAAWMDEHPDVVMATPRLLYPDGQPQYTAKRRPALLPLVARQTGLGCLARYERHYLMLDEDLDSVQEVEFCSGAFFLIRSEVFRAIGGFDEDYFMYVEDADITQKARQMGRAVYLPFAEVCHAWHRDARRRPRQFLWQLRSMARYFRKWGFALK